MPKIVDGPVLLRHLEDALGKDGRLRLAVAFWGHGALESLGLESDQDVEIVCRLRGGGTNPYEIERILEAGIPVWNLEKLHAKMGVAGSIAFVGSSNISTNGLGREADLVRGSDELNVVFKSERRRTELEELFEDFKGRAKKVTLGDPILRDAKTAWDSQPIHPDSRAGKNGDGGRRPPSLLSVIKSDPGWFKNQPIYALAYNWPSDDEEEALNQTKSNLQESDAEDDAYVDWKDLPAQGWFLNFEYNDGKLKFEGLSVREISYRVVKEGNHTLQLVRNCNKIPGFAKPDQQCISTICDALERHPKVFSRGTDGACVSLYELLEYLDQQ